MDIHIALGPRSWVSPEALPTRKRASANCRRMPVHLASARMRRPFNARSATHPAPSAHRLDPRPLVLTPGTLMGESLHADRLPPTTSCMCGCVESPSTAPSDGTLASQWRLLPRVHGGENVQRPPPSTHERLTLRRVRRESLRLSRVRSSIRACFHVPPRRGTTRQVP